MNEKNTTLNYLKINNLDLSLKFHFQTTINLILACYIHDISTGAKVYLCSGYNSTGGSVAPTVVLRRNYANHNNNNNV